MNTNVLRHAVNEIESLRRQNEILSAQVGVIEVFATALGMRNGNRGATIDVVWELQQEIKAAEDPAPEEAKA